MDWTWQLYREEDRPWTHEASIRYFNMWNADSDLAQATWEWPKQEWPYRTALYDWEQAEARRLGKELGLI